jgi:hypothetical protein
MVDDAPTSSTPVTTAEPDDPNHENNLVVRGSDGDPLPHPAGTRMIEKDSYDRVIEGLKMSADACAHIAKQEPQNGQTWMDIAGLLDRLRLQACQLAGLEATGTVRETQGASGNPYAWRRARDRFLEGLKQATGGMRQLATCFRGDFSWSLMAQQLEQREDLFRSLLYGLKPQRRPKFILPPGIVRH